MDRKAPSWTPRSPGWMPMEQMLIVIGVVIPRADFGDDIMGLKQCLA